MIDKKQVLSIISQQGPVIPRDIVKVVGGDTFIIGAMMSQMVDANEIRISHAKIGGSPVYYMPGQEPKLSKLYDHLPGMEKKAYDYLKQNKVVSDSQTEPALRVALRNIKDFAKALEVHVNDQKEIFWKWHLLPNQEAEAIIRQYLGKPKEEKPQPEEAKAAEAQQRVLETIEPHQEQSKRQEIAREESIPPARKEPEDETKAIKQAAPDADKQIHREHDELLEKVSRIFSKRNIEIIDSKIIRHNSEIDMNIEISSQVGKLRYYCKVKDKKKTDDKDLSSLYVEGEMRKMPVLYVTTGELTKKAAEMLNSQFKSISILRV